ncbi:hypothetical protein [Methyloceanibacter sp.]|uniref:hypothetical protein n=1 Tax=Methyloceanibacter sp. TaxID=1965321 RepID=UPI002CA57B84|nr:hypothetical protein [Methyloceanibacter sp.]HML93243.1 hypothetical protein [Methyloceanibacter sp.]
MTTDPTTMDASDAELRRLFSDYKVAVNSPTSTLSAQRRRELLSEMLCIPAEGPAGVAIKLALSGDWGRTPTVPSDDLFDFIRSALADAQRLGCVEPGALDLWSDVPGYRSDAQHLS